MQWGKGSVGGWQVKFAILPNQVINGVWVWLEKYEHKDCGWPEYQTRLYVPERWNKNEIQTPTKS